MASPYDFLFDADFGNWQPNLPDAPDQPEPWEAPDSTLPTGPPTDAKGLDPSNADYWSGKSGSAAQNWASAMFPLLQLQQNQGQFNTEFGEAQSRFWNQNQWSQGRDQFNMALATRQQNAQEQQAGASQSNTEAQLAAQALNDDVSRRVALGELDLAEAQQLIQEGQWQQSFGAQSTNDAHARQLADQQLAFQMQQSDRQLSLNEQQQLWSETYQQQQLELRAEEIDAGREAARYQSFGRGASPGRWASQWG